jgi:hypothetical protein
MTKTRTSIRVKTRRADKAAQDISVKSRTHSVHMSLRETVALKRFKGLMGKNAGKLSFSEHCG